MPAEFLCRLLQGLVIAEDLAKTDFLSVQVGECLDVVMKQLDITYRDELPILDGKRFVGVVRTSDVIARYRREIAQRDADQADGTSAW